MAYSMNVPFVIALFVQTLMYGLYITTLVHCLRWLFYDDKGWKLREKINWAMATITVLVFMFFTIDLALSLQITIGSLENWDKLLLDRMNVVELVIENITILIVDAVLIYRCWAVYGRSWRIVLFPVVLWFGIAIASIIGVLVVITEPMNIQLSLVWGIFFSCNIIVNIYATSAIIYRILRVAKETGRPSRRLHNTCRILGESGILYTISSILNLSVSMLGIIPKYFVLKVVVDTINFSMTGITFNLILIRVGQGRANTEETHFNSHDTFKQPPMSTLQFRTMSESIGQMDAERGGHAKTESRHGVYVLTCASSTLSL